MNDETLTCSFTVDQTPEAVFAAITNVRGWWSGNIEGPTDELGGEFTYRYKDMHYSKQRVTALVPRERVVWQVIDSHLAFVDDKTEWTGTEIRFDIGRKGGLTEVRFEHVGLRPAHACFEQCSNAWSGYVTGSLRKLIADGTGTPDPEEKPRATCSAGA